jgi:FK506-binding protein 2
MRSLLNLPLVLVLTALFALISASGLQIDITSPVECTRKTKKGDKVDMHYRGTLASDGSEFDASYNRGKPLSFQLGAGRVIKGYAPRTMRTPWDLTALESLADKFCLIRWDEGLLDMCIGEKRKLTIPPELAYGNQAVGPIPPGSTLIFETELMKINGKDEL